MWLFLLAICTSWIDLNPRLSGKTQSHGSEIHTTFTTRHGKTAKALGLVTLTLHYTIFPIQPVKRREMHHEHGT
jgi:hypothetical protein